MSQHDLSSVEASWLCSCKRCVTTRAHWRDGTPEPPVTARELLECQSMQSLGPFLHDSGRSKEWWARFDRFFAPWLREEVLAARIDDLEVAKYGAGCLVSAPDVRSWGHFPNQTKEPFTFDEIDGHELLFEGLYYGLLEDMDARAAVYAMRSFAAYLGRRDAIDSAMTVHIVREIDLWSPRFYGYLRGGPWYRPDGTPVYFGD